MKKLAIITTHPIQYYAPLFQLLHQRQKISIKVFYTWGETISGKYDPGFKKKIEWDTRGNSFSLSILAANGAIFSCANLSADSTN